MYPPDNGSTYSGHSYGSYNSGYPPVDDLSRSLGSPGSNGGPGDKRYSQLNNPAVGEGPMSAQMPSAPAGFNFSGGPGGFNGPGGFAEPGGFVAPPSFNNGFGGSSYPPPPGGGYPPANNIYPPSGGGGYPPANNMYPPPPNNGGYPPANNGGYPPANNGRYPPASGGYPPMGGSYSQPPLPPRNQFDGGYPPRPPGGNGCQRPPASAGPGMSGPGSNPSMQSVNNPKTSQVNQSAPELNKQTVARPPPQNGGGGPRPSSYRPTGSSSVGSIPPAQNNANRGMYWSPVNSQNTRIPADAVRAGTYGNDPVFVGRAKHKDSLQVGMVTMAKEGLVVLYDGKPVLFREYEVLCGPVGKYKWISARGRFDPKDIKDGKPLSCGYEKSGEALYAAVTSVHGRDYVGKAGAKIKGMVYPHKGGEDKTKTYVVLCEH